MHPHTDQHTREEKTIKLNKPTLWANVLGYFSRANAYSCPFDTERRGRFAPTSVPDSNVHLILLSLLVRIQVRGDTAGSSPLPFPH